MDTELTTVDQVVEALGGRRAVAALFGVKYNAVANWCVWDTFPKRLHLRLVDLFQEKGLKVSRSIFRDEQRIAS